MVRPTSFRFGSCTSPIFTRNGPAGFYFNVPRSGGNLPRDRCTRLREILTREESPEHDGDPDELADVERPGNVVPGEGAAGGVDESADRDPEIEPEPRAPKRVRGDPDERHRTGDREQVRERADVGVRDRRAGGGDRPGERRHVYRCSGDGDCESDEHHDGVESKADPRAAAQEERPTNPPDGRAGGGD